MIIFPFVLLTNSKLLYTISPTPLHLNQFCQSKKCKKKHLDRIMMKFIYNTKKRLFSKTLPFSMILILLIPLIWNMEKILCTLIDLKTPHTSFCSTMWLFFGDRNKLKRSNACSKFEVCLPSGYSWIELLREHLLESQNFFFFKENWLFDGL